MHHVTRALRALRASPAVSAVSILTMAVAIAANTAVFSVYDELVLHPVSMPDPDSLIAIWFNNPQRNTQSPSISIPRYEELRAETRSFASVGLSAFDSFTLTGHGDPVQLNGLRVSASFLPTLRITPAQGRNFTEAEDVPNGPAVCILSAELWQTQFGSRDVIGKTIELNGMSWEVIGIMPPRMTAPFGQVQVFAPRVFEVSGLSQVQIDAGATFAQPIARLKPGVSLDQARAELVAFSNGYKERYPAKIDAGNITEPRSFVSALVSGVAPTMYTLLGASACVLLIAGANVTALLLSRLMKRRKDLAVRLCLGATRGTLVTDVLIESAVMAACASVTGTLLAVAALKALQPTLAAQLPPNVTLSVNWRALLFASATAGVTALITGFWPAFQSSRHDLVEHVKDAARGSSQAHGHRSRQALVIAEVALSVALLIAAALLLSSFLRLQNIDAGFNPAGVAGSFVSIPTSRYATPARQAQFFEDVLTTLRAEPAVTGAALALTVPLGGNARSPYAVAGRPLPPGGQMPLLFMNIVSEDYFNLLGIPLMTGRWFERRDHLGAPPVCVVNETFAQRVFPGESAVGQMLLMSAGSRKVEIVGVVGDVKSTALNQPAPEEVYFPAAQLPRPNATVLAMTPGDPATLEATIRRAVVRTDATQATSFFATLESTVSATLATQRLMATLTVIFAGVALCLSLIGLYSVLAHVVAQRTSEIGIRMALGASRGQVVALVLRSGGTLVAIGLLLGVALAAALSRVLRQQLFEVEPLNAGIYVVVSGMFIVAASAACLAPSWRAARVDPVIAFRAE
jgi:predicted permease